MWPEVINTLSTAGRVGPAFPLRCQSHPDDVIFVKEPSDFAEVAADGGCNRNCAFRLGCGHACPRRCHPDDPAHGASRCREDCPRLRDGCEHACPKLCWEPCGTCVVKITSVDLPCGHKAKNVACFRARDPTSVECREQVDVRVPGCGHLLKVRECTFQETETLDDGFRHLECEKRCGKVCAPCIEACVCKCPHGECSMPCGAPCDRALCNLRCSKKLSCGHQCPSLCGETCPPPEIACPACATEKNKNHRVDLINLSTLGDHDVDADGPLIMLPGCKHVYTVESLDGQCEMGEFYHETDEAFHTPRALHHQAGTSGVKGCPDCREPIIGVQRYMRVTNVGLLSTMTLKYKKQMRLRLAELEENYRAEAANKVPNRSAVLNIAKELRKTCKVPQPLHKIYQASKAAALREGRAPDEPIEIPRPGIEESSLAKLLLVNVQLLECGLRRGQWATKKGRPTEGKIASMLGELERMLRELEALQGSLRTLTMTKTLGDSECVGLMAHINSQPRAAGRSASVKALDDGEEWARGTRHLEEARRREGSLALSRAAQAADFSREWAIQRVAQRFYLQRVRCLSLAANKATSEEQGTIKSKQLELIAASREQLRSTMLKQEGVSDATGSLSPAELATLDEELLREEVRVEQGGALTIEEKTEVYNAVIANLIGDCGGATETSVCPECGATIGGAGHRSAAGNTAATEFLDQVRDPLRRH
ncbi:hypothetical protein T484DRAFT_1858805 [Baffinella frigidus]|nr:hypothetical protein T484DRAFT_1858805 [Cryptophyta sp. CCMP2293]